MKKQQALFDELKKKAEFLNKNPDRDNEATRHDLLIYPVLTNKFGLGWDPTDLVTQATIEVPSIISESHIFRGATPKVRKPDILICPLEVLKNIAVIEEKKKQDSLSSLSDHRVQLAEYQSLFECNWGVLTDGEKWIIKRGFETYHEFTSIPELEKGIDDFRDLIGQKESLSRFKLHNTFDLIIISPFTHSHASIFPEYDNIPVIVCGVRDGKITNRGDGFQNFRNLQGALAVFPDLHPKLCTKRFTWYLGARDLSKLKQMRFETWAAHDIYSR